MKISFIIPIYNPEPDFANVLDCIKRYSRIYKMKIEIIIIDSESVTEKVSYIKNDKEVKYIRIKKSQFNHGGTRNFAFSLSTGDFVIFLTQDAIPKGPSSFYNLLNKMFDIPLIGMTYGRQLPKECTDFWGEFARKFNYPKKSRIKSWKDRNELGIKTVFTSNSFSAYRRKAFQAVGGFPAHTILSEDTYVAARMLEKGWLVSYEANACVYHSHNYSCLQEFKRYFDTGVFYGRENWILNDFSKAEGEGLKFAFGQLQCIMKEKRYYLVIEWFIRNLTKYVGYKMGILERYIPNFIKKRISMNKRYWSY